MWSGFFCGWRPYSKIWCSLLFFFSANWTASKWMTEFWIGLFRKPYDKFHIWNFPGFWWWRTFGIMSQSCRAWSSTPGHSWWTWTCFRFPVVRYPTPSSSGLLSSLWSFQLPRSHSGWIWKCTWPVKYQIWRVQWWATYLVFGWFVPFLISSPRPEVNRCCRSWVGCLYENLYSVWTRFFI